jgi:hypothetical protein
MELNGGVGTNRAKAKRVCCREWRMTVYNGQGQ